MSKCPHCQKTEEQVKAGKIKFGSQRSKCKRCQRVYTPDPKQQGYPDEVRQEALKLYRDEFASDWTPSGGRSQECGSLGESSCGATA